MGCFLRIAITCLVINLILPIILSHTSQELKYAPKRCETFFYDWLRCCLAPWWCLQHQAVISRNQGNVLGMNHNFLTLHSKSASIDEFRSNTLMVMNVQRSTLIV